MTSNSFSIRQYEEKKNIRTEFRFIIILFNTMSNELDSLVFQSEITL